MSFQRVHQSSSKNTETSWSTSQITPRPLPAQKPQQPPTKEEIENQAFAQEQFEATGLQLKEKYGTITPGDRERLGVLQAKTNAFWAQRMERASGFNYNFANIPVHHPHVPAMPQPQAEDKEGMVQRKAANTQTTPASAFDSNFSSIRIHPNSSHASAMEALAYTQGNDIYFAPGQFQPHTLSGQKLIGHEFAHVMQQRQGRVVATGEHNGQAINSDAVLEQEADEFGEQAAAQMQFADLAKIATEPQESEIATFTSPAQLLEDPSQPVFDTYKGKSINKIGHISAPAGQYEIAKTSGVNVRAKPNGALSAIAKVIYDTEVQVQALDNTDAFYFIIAKTGEVGWINKKFVALDPPDLGSRLHHITESNLTTILKNQYIDKGLWTLSSGNDYTTLAAAVVVANTGREGVSVDWAKAQEYKQENTFKTVFDPWMIDNFAIYHGSTILSGHNIWLPSPKFVRMLQQSGVIGSRPGWINQAVEIGKGIAGFLEGVISGIFGSLWDTLTGLWDLGKSIVSTIKSVLDGSLFASIESIYDTVTNMTWEDFKQLANDLITMGQSAFNNFAEQWNHPNAYKKWHFRGYTIGAIALEVVLAIFTGGATLGAKVLAKIGKYFPKLMRVLNKLLDVADDLHLRRRKNKADADSSKHDQDMNHSDRAWEQARIMAAIITEEHDAKDTPIAVLIPLLNTTIAARFKGVSGYAAIPKGPANTYKIIQRARRTEVDEHYTEKSKVTTDVQLGRLIGSGGNKNVYAVEGREGVVIGVLKQGKPAAAIEEEIKLIAELKSQGLATVEILEQTTYQGQPAILMKQYAQGSKEIVRLEKGRVRTVGQSQLLNARSIEDLRKIRSIMESKPVKIDDLQFLIGKDGSIVIADPLKVTVGESPSKNNLRMINLLIEAAEKNLK